MNEQADPLSAHLIAIDGQRWRKLRTKLTSIFTTSKLRHIFELIMEVSEKFKVYHILYYISHTVFSIDIIFLAEYLYFIQI